MAEIDGAPSNMRSERFVMQALGPGWHGIHTFCLAHQIHSVAEKVFPLTLSTMSGVIHVLLSVQHLLLVSEAMDKLVETKLVIREFKPLPKAAQEYRREVLSVFTPTKSQRMKRHLALNPPFCCFLVPFLSLFLIENTVFPLKRAFFVYFALSPFLSP